MFALTSAAVVPVCARRATANSQQAQRAAPVAAKLSARSCVASTSALSQGTLRASRLQAVSRAQSVRVVAAANIEFIKGVKESSVPDVKLTRSRDGGSGTALFYFDSPDVFEMQSDGKGGDITGMYLSDEEGTIQTVDVSARFINGKPKGIEAKCGPWRCSIRNLQLYIMKSAFEWDRFMRFMERYAEDNALGFSKST